VSRKNVDYRWNLRQIMANRGLFATTDLAPLLAERGVDLSAAQIYRLVAQRPERLSLHTLAALCDALACTPNDLVEPIAVAPADRRTATAGASDSGPRDPGSGPRRPRRARIVDDSS
jgi:DNA-binding Xre family transcriptional regulator